MHFQVITILPEIILPIKQHGVIGRAFDKDILSLNMHSPRDFTTDAHRTVDDRPYGGGPGMVMKPEPLALSIEHAISHSKNPAKKPLTVYLSPQGKTWNQSLAQQLAQLSELVIVCGRYEGVDERFIDSHIDMEISLGDFVLSGGELGAMLMIDSIGRLIPEVLGHPLSAEQDSFSNPESMLLDCPHYTRPEIWRGAAVPDVLKSGDHRKISDWRAKQSRIRTWQRRPEQVKSSAPK
jgi:tRNA (guanine37-N1)-methyltransferase